MCNLSEAAVPPGRLTPDQFTAVAYLLLTCGVVGFVENLLILIVFVHVSALRSPTNGFVMAILVCDMLVTVLGIPFSATSSFRNKWIFGRSGCYWYGFTMSLLGYMIIFLLTAISVERYVLITKLLPRPVVKVKVVNGIIFLCFLIALILAGIPFLGWSSYTLEAGYFSCSINWRSETKSDSVYVVTIFVLCFIIPVFIMSYSYFNIYRTVHLMAAKTLRKRQSHAFRRNMKIEYRTTRNVVLLMCAFLICWTPYSIVAVWCVFSSPENVSPVTGTVPVIIAKSSVIWNPLAYVLVNKQFRRGFCDVFVCRVSLPQLGLTDCQTFDVTEKDNKDLATNCTVELLDSPISNDKCSSFRSTADSERFNSTF